MLDGGTWGLLLVNFTMSGEVYGSFPELGVPFWGPHNTNTNILGSIFGSPYFGKLPYDYWVLGPL